ARGALRGRRFEIPLARRRRDRGRRPGRRPAARDVPPNRGRPGPAGLRRAEGFAGPPARASRLRLGQPERECLSLLPDAGAARASVRVFDDRARGGRPPAPRAPEDTVPLSPGPWGARDRDPLWRGAPVRRTADHALGPDRRLPGRLATRKLGKNQAGGQGRRRGAWSPGQSAYASSAPPFSSLRTASAS